MASQSFAAILTPFFPFQLSMWRCSDELRCRATELHNSSKRDAKHYIGDQLSTLCGPVCAFCVCIVNGALLLTSVLMQSFGSKYLQMNPIVLFLVM